VSTLQANDALDRQVSDDGALVLLWRKERERRHEGLLLVVGVCPFPGCPARHALVEGYLVGDNLRAVTHDAGKLRLEYRAGRGKVAGRAFGVSVGIDDGLVEVADPVWSRRAVAWLEDALDPALREVLRRRFETARAAVDAVLGEGWEDRPRTEGPGWSTSDVPDHALEAVLAGLERGLSAQDGAPRLGPLRAPRPGRNDPCPCGSGRKYKRCCLGAA
jgi:hypothetical protein